MKRQTHILLAATVLASAPALSMAASTITFNGKVLDQTCTITVEGDANPQVNLPDVSVSQLTAAGMTAGLKTFDVTVSGCTLPTTDLSINTVFWGDAIENGALKNQVDSGAQNVALQLLSDNTGSENSIIKLNGSTSVPGLIVPAGKDTGTKTFAVRYLATGAATAGPVQSVVNYDFTYQ